MKRVKNYKILEYAPTSHNKRYTQIALFGQFGLHKTPVRRALSAGTPFVGFCSTTFFCARKNASHFSLSGTKKRRIPRTLGEIKTEYIQKYKTPPSVAA